MSILDNIRQSLEIARAIPGQIGLRRFQINLIQQVYASSSPEDSVSTIINTQIGCKDLSGTIQNPYVEEIRCKTLFSAGGLYEDVHLKIGPISKNFTSGGYYLSQINPIILSKQSGTNGTITFSSGVCIFASTTLDTTKLIIGQSIIISDSHTGNNGTFKIATIVNTTSITYANTHGVNSTSVGYQTDGRLVMHYEILDLDNNHTSKWVVSTVNEYDLTHIIIELKMATGDFG